MRFPIEETTTPCIYHAKWRISLGLLTRSSSNYIQDLAARSLHRERMKHVCQSIKLYKQWRCQQRWLTELFFFILMKISLDSALFFIESQVCNICFKKFSPEIVLSKHLSTCRGPGFEDFEEEMDFYRSFFEDDEYDNNNDYYGDYLKCSCTCDLFSISLPSLFVF